MGFSAVWHIFKHIKLHVFFQHSCWDCKSPDKCLHHNTEWKAFIFYFLQCLFCQHCTLVEGSGCLVHDLWSSAIENLDPENNLSSLSQLWGELYRVLFLENFFVFHLEVLLRLLLPAPRKGHRCPDLPLSSEAGSWCTFTGCSIALSAPVSAEVQRYPMGCTSWTTARPVLGGGCRQTPLPALLSATAFPGTASHLQVLTPIAGPQAYHVLACSETNVERCVFRVASHFCLKHLLYCVLSCCLLFPQTRNKPRFWKPSLILFTWCF